MSQLNFRSQIGTFVNLIKIVLVAKSVAKTVPKSMAIIIFQTTKREVKMAYSRTTAFNLISSSFLHMKLQQGYETLT